ncbi:phospholipid-transporting ATPase VA-like isoform X2 [Xenia sp. Carnegie-2017]|uniref:phospholipid-transporting ATPase VA-like isoform X2 n=1 Tax=Xenia sp. Carnegie-2017 TaxID=2897299 RepID=UPI001F033FE1|nr:phospholipid-transporting ATPase VA-like isoform X2 [Xenia sp. Carnegie-2017]
MPFAWSTLHNSDDMEGETTQATGFSSYGSTHTVKNTDYRLVIPSQVFTKQLEIKHANLIKFNLRNKVKTTKYTIWNFLPKNLFEQFHRFANIYFLVIAILNWVPAIKAFAREITMIPLLFVLCVTLVKDLFEDGRRRRSDKKVNNRESLVYNSSTNSYVKTKWRYVRPGDIVKISNNEIIPADILLLSSSDPNNICHIETANLDGETNLKQREVARNINQGDESNNATNFSSFIYCEKPNSKIYQFNGYMDLNGNCIPIGTNNLLLRGCVIRNTDTVEGIVVYAGHDTKAMQNNSGPRSKRSKLERDINTDVLVCVVILISLCVICAIGNGFWTANNEVFDHQYTPELDVNNEDVIQREPALEAFVRFWTYIIVFQVLIPISLYVTVEIVKLGQCYFIRNDIELYFEEKNQPAVCTALNINEDLGQIKYIFSDKTGTLTENKMVFRRCTINGKDYAHATRRSSQEEASSHLPVDVDEIDASKSSWDDELAEKINNESNDEVFIPIKEFFTLLAICNTVVVSSHANHANGESNGNLNDSQDGQLNHVVDGVINEMYGPRENSTNVKPVAKQENLDVKSLKYEAESPDEAALVKSAKMYGYKLLSRGSETVSIEVPGEDVVQFELLHVLVFDSIRKRMSVIVRRKTDGKIIMYCKGADTAVIPQLSRLSKSQKITDTRDRLDGKDSDTLTEISLVESTETHLNIYAREGLRTLCMARKELTENEYDDWLSEHKKAELSIHNRDELLQESYSRMECDMELLGATGIEDRLQDGVPDAIATLRNAGIKVWVLTGDKQETAINIAHSCRLLDDHMDKITLNASSQESCSEQISAWLEKVGSSAGRGNEQIESSKQKTFGLVIDGQTLQFALTEPLDLEFLRLAKSCEVVVCCRAAPAQKASVVRLVREELGVMTLAIGDGANDVSMIQVADIGVGISGQEGMQAVQASDFAIGRFRFLVRLLLVHGHWCYDRISKLILYFFYKNMMFVMVLFWFQLYNGFSGSNAINDVNLIFFNLIFTSLPPIISGIWDQDVSCDVLLAKPFLYAQGRESMLYSRKWFWITMADAVFQSVVIFFSAFLVYYGTNTGLFTVGITLHQCAVIVASLQIALETNYWTVIHGVALGLSVLISFVWCIIYNVISPTFPDYYVAVVTMGTANFWMLCILTAFVSMIPRQGALRRYGKTI